METDKIISKIRKLLALGTNAGATEAERESAMRMAHKFLAKHNLDMSALDEKPEEREKNGSKFYGRPWAQLVCASIAKLLFCKYVFTTAKRATDTQHYFIGKHSNSVSATLLAEYVVLSIRREGSKLQRATGEDNAFMRSFCLGASHAIYHRVEKMMKDSAKQTAEAATPGTAVTLASVYKQEEQANDAWLDAARNGRPLKIHGNIGKGSSRAEAEQAGRDFGAKIPLHSQVDGTPTLAIGRDK